MRAHTLNKKREEKSAQIAREFSFLSRVNYPCARANPISSYNNERVREILYLRACGGGDMYNASRRSFRPAVCVRICVMFTSELIQFAVNYPERIFPFLFFFVPECIIVARSNLYIARSGSLAMCWFLFIGGSERCEGDFSVYF